MQVYDILKQIAGTTKKTEKEEILLKHKDNNLLKDCFLLAYSPTIQFYQKSLPVHEDSPEAKGSLEEGLSDLSNLYERIYTGNHAKAYLQQLLYKTEPLARDVLKRVVLKDLRCGVGANTINKVWKNLIVKPPRLGAASMNDKSLNKMKSIKNLAIELKSDGSYCSSICGEDTTMMSRNGNPMEIVPLQKHLSCGAFNGFALEGELVYSLDKATRSEGNGFITKVVKGTASEEEKENTLYQVWDCIDIKDYQPKGEYKTTNKDRREILEKMMSDYTYWCQEVNTEPKVFLINREEYVSVEKAFEIFENYVRDGYEGAIAKDMDCYWKDLGKPTFNIKMKRKEPADLKVVGWYYAETGSKYEDMLGGFYCESECGKIKVSVGSGFSDEERKLFIEEQPSIIEVEYDSVTKDKRSHQESLFLPIYKRPRYDKNVADCYQEIIDKQKIK